jgi:hypothetical protein
MISFNKIWVKYIIKIEWNITNKVWPHLCTRPTPYLDFYNASSLKQQSMDRHVAPLGHIILIPSQPVFALTH